MAHVGAHMRDATQDGPWAFLRFSPLTFASYAVLLGAVAALLVLSSSSFYDFVPAEKAAARAPAAEEAPGSPGTEDRKHFRLVVVGRDAASVITPSTRHSTTQASCSTSSRREASAATRRSA